MTDVPIKVVLGEKIYITDLINAVDVVDGVIIITDIKVEGTVDPNKLGRYPLTISVSDKAGNIATKTVNVLVDAKGQEYDFIKNPEGYWINDTTNIRCSFWLYNGYYTMEIQYLYSGHENGTGILTFVEANPDNTIMKFNWDYNTYSRIDWGKLSRSPVERKTVNIDIGIPHDDKISIDIGDGNGLQEYRFYGMQTE